MVPAPPARPAPVPDERSRPLLLLLFLLSGATGLAYQVLWRERLSLVFGDTVEAAAATLAVFLLGFGAGAGALARHSARLRRPLRAYGLLEIAAGAGALLFLLLAEVSETHYGAWAAAVGGRGPLLQVLRLALTLALLGPAAFLLGATWPVLAEEVVARRERLGRAGAALYAVHGLGASLGALAAGFLLAPRLGLRGGCLAAAGTNLAVGLLALALSRRRPPAGRPAPKPRRSPAPVPAHLALLALLSGGLFLALEVLWTRLHALFLPNSAYTFALVLATLLLGLALGGGVARLLAATRLAPGAVLAPVLALGGVLVALSGALAPGWAAAAAPPTGAGAWPRHLGLAAVHVVLGLLPAAALLGMVFPLLLAWAGRGRGSPGAPVGLLTLANTAGAVVGALAAAFLLLPHLGLWRAIGAVGLAYAAAGGVVAAARRAVAGLLAAALACGGILLLPRPGADVLAGLAPGERLLGLWEGSAGTVAVVEEPHGARKLRMNAQVTLGGTDESRWEALQAHLPLALHPAPRRVFLLGLGTGITAGAVLEHDVERLVVAERVREVVLAARAWFGPHNAPLFEDPEARVVVEVEDGRHHLLVTDARYDVIVGDLFFPWEAGTAHLYTEEHFRLVGRRLAPGGLFAQWLPLYQMSEAEFLGVAATLARTFPSVTLWRGDFHARRPIVALVARAEARPLDPSALVSRLAGLRGEASLDLARDAHGVAFHLYAGNLGRASALLARGRLHADDRAWIAFEAPRSAVEGRAFVARDLLAFEEALQAAVPPEEDPLLAGLSEAQRRAVQGGLLLRALNVHLGAARLDRHRQARLAYLRLVPPAMRPDLGAWLD